MKPKLLLVLIVPIVVIAAVIVSGVFAQKEDTPDVVQPDDGQAGFSIEPQVDEQGAVIVEVSQINLNGPNDNLEFYISLNTHSVDLGIDLTLNSELVTDTGITLQAVKWEAPSGGHHVSGRLYFPATVGGKPVLDGVKTVTLYIRNVDTPERIFTWNLEAGS